jgi:PAS domain S-box-containing protein
MPDRIAIEELFKSSEAQFQYVADYIPSLVWIANPAGWIYWYNKSWYEYTGTTPEQMEGWGWQVVHDPAILPTVLEKWGASIATGEPFEMVFPLRRADGVFCSFLTRINPVRDAKGKILRWVGTNFDISRQHDVEALLAQKDVLLRAAFRQSYAFTVLLSADGTIVETNDAALQAAAKERAEVIGIKFWDGPWWSQLPEEKAALERGVAAAAQGESVRGECRYRLSDGSIRFADRTLAPLRADNGAIVMIVATGIDTTEQQELRLRLEERVADRTRDLEERNKQLRDLSARLLRGQDDERRRLARDLHDSVGQMLAGLTMNMGTLSKETDKLSPDAATALVQNKEVLKQLNEEIRTISHLLHPPLLKERGIVSALRAYAQGFAERSKIDVQLDLPEALEGLPEGLDLAIFRIVQECLTNIYRHSGSPVAIIRVGRTPQQIYVQVQDHGKGMPAGPAPQQGVGLRGVRERARDFGGTLHIQSNDKGTVIIANFPDATGSEAETARGSSRAAGPPDQAATASG